MLRWLPRYAGNVAALVSRTRRYSYPIQVSCKMGSSGFSDPTEDVLMTASPLDDGIRDLPPIPSAAFVGGGPFCFLPLLVPQNRGPFPNPAVLLSGMSLPRCATS